MGIERKTRAMGRLVIVALGLAAAACGKAADAPSCEAAGAKLVVLAQASVTSAKVDDEVRGHLADQLPAMRDALVEACKESDWAPAVRRCLVDAIDPAAFEQCQHALTAAQRDRLVRGATADE